MKENTSVLSPLIAVLVVVASVLFSLFLGAAFLVVFGEYFALAFSEFLLIVFPLGYMLSMKINIRKYVGLEVKPKTVLLGIAFGVILLLVDILISFALTAFVGTSEAVEESNVILATMSQSPNGLIAVIIALSSAGICEEFLFRGFLQTAISSRYPSVVAILVSSIAFGFFHFDPQGIYMIAGFLMGVVLGYIYHRFHSYVISAVAHATLNLIVLSLLLI